MPDTTRYTREQLNNVRIARRAARSAGIDPNIFHRQMKQEANFTVATSPAGAQGPAQIMPGTARAWGVKNVNDPVEAYNAAAKNMRKYLDSYGGSWAKALTAYNAGPGRVGGPLPTETQNYINIVLMGDSDRKNDAEPAAPKADAPRATPGTVSKGTAPTLTSPSSTVDTKAAVKAAIFDPRKKMSLASRILENVTSGNFTTDTPAVVTPGKAPKYTSAPKADAPASDAAEPSSNVALPKSGKNDWGVLEHVGRSGIFLRDKFKIGTIGGYRANDPYPDHPSRRAMDLMVGSDMKKGQAIADELTKNHKQHKIEYIIWNQRIWHPGRGWKAMSDRGNPTQNHKDHVHAYYKPS